MVVSLTCSAFLHEINSINITPLPWSQRLFLIFPRERDQEQAAKRRQRVAKAMGERKTSGYLGLESHFHADDSCQTRQIAMKRVTNGNLADTCLSATIFLSGGSLSIGLIILFTSEERAVRVDSRVFPPK